MWGSNLTAGSNPALSALVVDVNGLKAIRLRCASGKTLAKTDLGKKLGKIWCSDLAFRLAERAALVAKLLSARATTFHLPLLRYSSLVVELRELPVLKTASDGPLPVQPRNNDRKPLAR